MNTYATKNSQDEAQPTQLKGDKSAQLVISEDVSEKGTIQRALQQAADAYIEKKTIQPKANQTGLPDQLKSGIEQLSGHSMDDVKVHYNSSKPAQLRAHAYAQGSEIHLGPNQEKHLPHEAWHVVQQKQGRVKPTAQLKENQEINDSRSLEKEVDLKSAPNPNELVVQRAPMNVSITNGITHVVKKINNSLFGEGKEYTDGEIGAKGELTQGQMISIDDEKTFLSRRGPNQEIPENRASNEISKPSELWYHVLTLRGEDVSKDKLYIRSGTFVQADEVQMDSISREDIEQLQKMVTEAINRGSRIQGPWNAFMQDAVSQGALKESDAVTSGQMIRRMSALSELGDLLAQHYSSLSFAVMQNLPPDKGIKLISPILFELIKKQMGIMINALGPGGNFMDWTRLSDLTSYLQISFLTFQSVFSDFALPEQRLDLLKTLRSSDVNIEKFITLMSSVQLTALMAASGPESELEAIMGGQSTASAGNGSGLLNYAFGKLMEKYLASKYSTQEIIDLDYTDTETSDLFMNWLTTEGFTIEIIQSAIRKSLRASGSQPIVSTDFIESFLKDQAKSYFS